MEKIARKLFFIIDQNLPISDVVSDQLRNHAETILQKLPQDLQFGWNKVSHVMELAARGTEFVALPNVFIVHLPHAPSLSIAKYRSSDQYRK